MMLRCMNTPAMGHADHYRTSQAAACAIAHAGHVVADLIERRVNETHELDFGHRSQPLCGHAEGHAGNHAFSERRVLHTIFTELLLESCGGTEDTTVQSDVLT